MPSAAGNATGAPGSTNSASICRQAPHGGLGLPFRFATAMPARESPGRIRNRPHQRRPLRADRQPVTRILNIGAGYNFATRQANRRTHTKLRIGRISVLRGPPRVFHQIFERLLPVGFVITSAPRILSGRRLEANASAPSMYTRPRIRRPCGSFANHSRKSSSSATALVVHSFISRRSSARLHAQEAPDPLSPAKSARNIN